MRVVCERLTGLPALQPAQQLYLCPDHYNLRQLYDTGALSDRIEDILEAIHHWDKFLHSAFLLKVLFTVK